MELSDRLSPDLQSNISMLTDAFGASADLVVHLCRVDGRPAALAALDNLYDKGLLSRDVTVRLLAAADLPADPAACLDALRERVSGSIDVTDVADWSALTFRLASGFAVLFLDGCDRALTWGLQDFAARGVTEPDSEVTEHGSREGFCEVLRINLSLVRRRLKTPQLTLEVLQVGRRSRTEVALCYLRDQAAPQVVDTLRRRLQDAGLDVLFESGFLLPFVEGRRHTLLSTVGTTERPDTLCARISEGRVGVLVDGTPFALLVPSLFSEQFQSPDDYTNRPVFAAFIRLLRYGSFLVAVLFPGVFVALGQFDPEAFPAAILIRIADAQRTTPFSVMAEALLIHLIFEILREAGLRLPRPVGHAISIVGALVIGESAVSAGLIGAPMVMVVAITTVSSFVVPGLYNAAAVLRFAFILTGGLTGLYGVMLLAAALLCGLCALDSFGVPYLAPIAPFDPAAMRDTFRRASWQRLGRRTARIQSMRGSQVKRGRGGER